MQRAQSDDRQALATFGATRFDDLATTLGGHPGTITNLAGALFAVRAECGLHDVKRKRGSEVPQPAGSVKGRVRGAVGPFEILLSVDTKEVVVAATLRGFEILKRHQVFEGRPGSM